ncbi:malto-oligosyltrehalose synthase [Castellaniella defragrans]|uniref:(1->4)-alpha-D-glucan 1-alpha-D-glucosylmutase n=2 Tax=Castellaniella defragrans TaxID=75697 RepID=A0A7W9WMP7_CASDE|nr:malto-oligosyltrehalose synthase [Castellaniella defragrans]MBB6083016.1 (1->4)-alpha-D-glucan 1-alpha-D-glucosylmutase [Castellaniella defragrans]
MIPRATARLQLHADFTFDDARAVLDHYAALGVSHLYLSPLTRARPGSTHGYDVIDPTRVDEALGGRAGLRRLAGDAAARRMGLIADIVPNHMAADARNPWWRDVLQHGAASAHARVFDIDWTAGEGRILLPLLPRSYGDALAAGDIRLVRGHGAAAVLAGGQALPLARGDGDADPRDFDPASDAGRARLHALLERQHYRLAWWRAAACRLNWRRFFLVSELVGVRVEDPAVFQATHALILDLYGEGLLDGLRIDHIDGLAEPGAYLRRLRAALQAAAPDRNPYLVVEKILAPGETPDRRWPIEGTTGYDFMDDAGALLHAPAARRPLLAFWRACGGSPHRHARQLRAIRASLLDRQMAGEFRALVQAWAAAARHDPRARRWGTDAWRRLLRTWLAGFPVYRSYAEDGGPSEADRAAWAEAGRVARTRLPAEDAGLLDLWLAWLAPPSPRVLPALRRLQQLTPPLAAKSLEDTLFYRYGPLLSRNEVGASPRRFSLDGAAFHRRNLRRARDWPLAMLATATHDHKRGEDVRARLAALTEMPGPWTRFALRWLELPPRNRLVPTDRYMLLQTLVGSWPSAWPADATRLDPRAVRAWLARVAQWQRKALREAGLRSSWTDPDAAYEADAQACLDALDPDAEDPRPLKTLAAFAAPLAAPGWINGLAQALLRNTAPGIPDLYQGTETWDESLVDPDNRRPVDHRRLDRLLAGPPPHAPTPADWRGGRVKQYLIQTALALRATHPRLFCAGSGYVPVAAEGPRARHVVAFLRGGGEDWALVVAPRLCALPLAGYARGEAAEACRYWEGTALVLPPAGAGGWKDVLGAGAAEAGSDGRLPLAALLRRWPVALCVRAAGASAP